MLRINRETAFMCSYIQDHWKQLFYYICGYHLGGRTRSERNLWECTVSFTATDRLPIAENTITTLRARWIRYLQSVMRWQTLL